MSAFDFLSVNAVAQEPRLAIKWYPATDTAGDLIKVALRNDGPVNLPASGWAIYCNASRMLRLKSAAHLSGTMLNGYLFRISPADGFLPLLPGQQTVFELRCEERVFSITDGPAGFYFIAGLDGKGTLIEAEAPDSAVNAYTEKYKSLYTTAGQIYDRNEKARVVSPDKLVKVFPTPESYKEAPGHFIFSDRTMLVSDAIFAQERNYLYDQLAGLGYSTPKTGQQLGNTVMLRYKKMDRDAYRLLVTSKKIMIEAGSPSGAFYGIQSLLTSIAPQVFDRSRFVKTFRVPNMEVSDAPRFSYRGIMLDVARNFQTKAAIKKLLDVMGLYKLNTLHLHLNDDEGWRLEIAGLPELTEVGSRRGHTPDNKAFLQPAFGSGPDTAKGSGNGHYSRSDFIELLHYAKARHIVIIPEVESPGHARAAIRSMDARYHRLMEQQKSQEAREYLLRDPDELAGDTMVVAWWNDNVMDIALPSTYRFIGKVVSEIQSIYQDAEAPLTAIHMGGDEVSSSSWKTSRAFQALQAANPEIGSPDEGWYYFWTKIAAMFRSKGLTLSGWEEMARKKIGETGSHPVQLNAQLSGPGYTFDIWNNTVGEGAAGLGALLANAGYKIILSCVSNNYFDMSYSRQFREPGYYWGGFVDLEKTFSFIPYDYNRQLTEENREMKTGRYKDSATSDAGFTQTGKENILGIKGLLWSEKITSAAAMEYMMFPRLLALAERAWAKDPPWASEKNRQKQVELYDSAYLNFINVIGQRELPRLDSYAGGIAYRIPPPGVTVKNDEVWANAEYPGYPIRYTTDGSEPDKNSALYTQPIRTGRWIKRGLIKIKGYNFKGRGSRTVSGF